MTTEIGNKGSRAIPTGIAAMIAFGDIVFGAAEAGATTADHFTTKIARVGSDTSAVFLKLTDGNLPLVMQLKLHGAEIDSDLQPEDVEVAQMFGELPKKASKLDPRVLTLLQKADFVLDHDHFLDLGDTDNPTLANLSDLGLGITKLLIANDEIEVVDELDDAADVTELLTKTMLFDDNVMNTLTGKVVDLADAQTSDAPADVPAGAITGADTTASQAAVTG